MLVLCRETTELLTDAKEGALPFGRRVMLRFHLAICPACQQYARQMDATVAALGNLAPDEAKAPHDVLLDEFRKSMPPADGGTPEKR